MLPQRRAVLLFLATNSSANCKYLILIIEFVVLSSISNRERRLFVADYSVKTCTPCQPNCGGLPGPPRPLHELRPPPPALSEQMPRLLPHEHVRNGGLHVSLSIRYFFRWKCLAFSGAPPATRRAKRARVRTVPNASLAVRSASGTKVVA
jgi:hypothetical protein